jgi:uncharacterized protein YodC (DUF2158 family)
MQPPRENIVIWREGQWRCEFHPGFGGASRLEVYHGEALVTAEASESGEPSLRRAEILRQRVLRGDLRPAW